jgi:AAA domain
MYVVTFYSFKGGVGRTMALVNTAVELTLRGKRVLVVDFDLEAPGIQTYEPFSDGTLNLGVVDYVTDYIRDGQAPDFRRYVVENKIDDKSIWLMPAGLSDVNYAHKLNSIDWLGLYRDKNGYLMFEDLKQQWKLNFEFDYVLIDSRTGHTDVGGICTRQLPNSNVLMFFPNEQNISGLKDVANTVRAESNGSSGARICIHFCPSNVPDLDDEDLILQRHFERAMEKLGYEEPASVIHHYNSLALLDQKIFVRDRKKTRLADEYRTLVDAIVSENLEDRSGALSKLEKIRTSIRSSRAVAGSAATEQTLDSIFRLHSADGEVAWSLAAAYYGLGNVKGELESLNLAIEQGFEEMRARSRRASLLGTKQIELVQHDLKVIIASSESTVPQIISAISRLREIDVGWLSAVAESERIRQLDGSDLERVAEELTVDSEGASLASKLMLDKFTSRGDQNEVSTQLLLALIATGNYEKVIEVLGNDRSAILSSGGVEKVFNLACAEWGQSGNPPRDLLQRTLELGAKASDRLKKDPNFLQCLSLSSYLLGFVGDATSQLELAKETIQAAPPSEIFSCWRYLYVNKSEFTSDLEKMESQMILGGKLIPEFLQQRSFWPNGPSMIH